MNNLIQKTTTADPTTIPGGDTINSRRKLKRNRTARDPLKSPKLYFHSGTQAAIGQFQKYGDNISARNDIYVKEIMPAFTRLVENLIKIHNFVGLHDTQDDLKNDCVSFLFETLPKFDMTRGSNAFSYFNVVAKNWLIIRSKQRVQRMRRTISLDDPCSLSQTEQYSLEEQNVVPSQEQSIDSANTPVNIIATMHEIQSRAKTANEIACINAIVEIFEHADQIDLLNKSAVLMYLRELSGLSSKQLTAAMQTIKRLYKQIKGEDSELF